MFRVFVVFFLTAFSVLANEPALTASQWLEKMSQSMKTLNYQGTVAFFKNGRLDTMKYSHSSLQNVEQERLLSLNSPMREVIRDAGIVSCVFDKSKKIIVNHRPVSKSFIIDLPVDFTDLDKAYHISLQGEESVAMRFSRIISIKPIDSYRYSRKIWIDNEYFLPLKVEVYNLAGKVLEQVVYTEIKIVDQLDFVKVDNDSKNANIKHIHLPDSVSIEENDFNFDNVPVGFKTVFFTRMNVGSSDKKADHLLLSDGFSSVSVYREAKSENVQLGSQSMGSVNSFTHVVENQQITAMGDVPIETVQMIAQGAVSH